ncbi:relaxase/mobilization nuclease domain-containing protein [Bifidobacterium sp. SO1]|uniref:relaxase/mobilization nuclease domain-containing protein n=1 Tax=Bifidobacterium sp. SO1 TaxID=2809029 RepID=UPI001BDDB106|nr:relaxase/mobilization nuclease domain-containing protein [Bifidobacterium sp. SO1]
MAYVKVGQIKVTLDKAVAYITNPGKTMDYRLVSTNTGNEVNDSKGIAETFIRNIEHTKGGAKRNSAVLAHHIIQSFSPDDELTPEEAHSLGVRFVRELTGGCHDYVIATHVDKGHLHNHILVCPTNNLTHRNMRVQRNTLAYWRGISDQLCRENGLNVIDQRRARPAPQLNELYLTAKGVSRKDNLRAIIDQACAKAMTFDRFIEKMNDYGIEVTVRGRHLTFTEIETGRKMRDDKLGVNYNELSIMSKLDRHTLNVVSFNQAMIAERGGGKIKVWLPNTQRQLLLTIPVDRLVRDGKTWRAYLPDDAKQVLTDPNGMNVKTIPCDDLYQWFSRPGIRIADYVQRHIDSAAHRSLHGRLKEEAIACDRLAESLDELHALGQVLDAGTTRMDMIDDLTVKVGQGAARMQSLIVAIADAADRNDTVTVSQLETQLDEERAATDRDARDVLALQRILERDQQKNDDEQQRKRRENVRPKPRRNAGR